MSDPYDAFCAHGAVTLPGADAGPLAGLRFAAKDLYDIQGHVTGFGSPDWLRTHPPATRTAPAVAMLVAAGATMVGKTHTDELAFGLFGANHHYGMPINPVAPDRVPGGSSSGSAAAVAGGLVDFALGTDTGGSVRIPAAFCGIFGIRPTHGRVPLDGVCELVAAFDTAGWFARDAVMLERVGQVLLGEASTSPPPVRLLVAADAIAEADPTIAFAMRTTIDRLGPDFPGGTLTRAAPDGLEHWMGAFRAIQGYLAWRAHRAWIEAEAPDLGPTCATRFAFAAQVTEDDYAAARVVQDAARARLDRLLGDSGVLCLPTAPVAPPLRDAGPDALEAARARIVRYTCLAGLAGLPQVTVPIARVRGAPVGLSLIGPRGSDMALLALAARVPVVAPPRPDGPLPRPDGSSPPR